MLTVRIARCLPSRAFSLCNTPRRTLFGGIKKTIKKVMGVELSKEEKREEKIKATVDKATAGAPSIVKLFAKMATPLISKVAASAAEMQETTEETTSKVRGAANVSIGNKNRTGSYFCIERATSLITKTILIPNPNPFHHHFAHRFAHCRPASSLSKTRSSKSFWVLPSRQPPQLLPVCSPSTSTARLPCR